MPNSKLPLINYRYWFEKNKQLTSSRKEGEYVKRHHAVTTQILNKYKKNSLCLAYFTQLNSDQIIPEYNRIKQLTYWELENEIIAYISHIISDMFDDKDLILKVFDLIQIWGGRPGGNNIYNRNGDDRVNLTWLKNYIIGIKLASTGQFSSYETLIRIRHLQLPFASKHVNFYSRHLGNESLIIIDEKISHSLLIKDPKTISNISIQEINLLFRQKAIELNLFPWQVEKALFSFHSKYFEASKVINREFEDSLDEEAVGLIEFWYKKL